DDQALGRGVGRAAGDVVGGNRLARLGQALLVGVGIGTLDVVGNRALQVLGRAESERARVADVELDQLPALGLEFAGHARQVPAHRVAGYGQALAGGEAGNARWPGRVG